MAIKKTNAKTSISKAKSPIKTPVMPMKASMSMSSSMKQEDMDCCTPGHKKWSHKVIIALVAVNLILSIVTVSAVSKLWKNELTRIGGKENYKMAQELYQTPGYKEYNRRQIETAKQQMNADTTMQLPGDQTVETQPETATSK